MRLAVLGILTIIFVLCITGLATVLTLAAIMAGMGDGAASVVLRYVGLGIGAILVVDVTVLFLYLVFLVATTELALSRASDSERVSTDQRGLPEAPEDLSGSGWEEAGE